MFESNLSKIKFTLFIFHHHWTDLHFTFYIAPVCACTACINYALSTFPLFVLFSPFISQTIQKKYILLFSEIYSLVILNRKASSSSSCDKLLQSKVPMDTKAYHPSIMYYLHASKQHNKIYRPTTLLFLFSSFWMTRTIIQVTMLQGVIPYLMMMIRWLRQEDKWSK